MSSNATENELYRLRKEAESNPLIRYMYPGTKVVFGYGNGSNGVAIIGEAPARRGGNMTGEPFTSQYSGKLISDILADNHLLKSECFVSNVCFCSPPMNAQPTVNDIARCMPYLLRALAIIQPKVVIVLGKTAEASFGRTHRIGGHGGLVFSAKFNFVFMKHPSFILRQSYAQIQQYKDNWKEVLMSNEIV